MNFLYARFHLNLHIIFKETQVSPELKMRKLKARAIIEITDIIKIPGNESDTERKQGDKMSNQTPKSMENNLCQGLEMWLSSKDLT